MANFKLFLLNLRNTSNGVPTFISQPISIFSNEQEEGTKGFVLNQNPSFCYSYDEKFQIHQNSQKTLSFSMDRRITREDRIEDNPFIYYLYAGAQLLLVDRYDNHHLMTIKKISFTFKEFNTVYNFECQDSFSYQLSRQNNGYEITNDASTTDFIGAKQVDWWVLCKIHPECNISYSYVKLGDNLILDKKKIKHKLIESDYFTSVPFSGSGTANSVLISLGDLIGLQLKVYERFDFNTGELRKYYWFEPKKNLRPSGLKYSPHSSVQSFSMTHEGQSLSSVFNIQTHQIGDEMVSLIPSVPTFFKQWFTSQSWTDTKFVNGLFRSKCEEQVYRFDNITIEEKLDDDDKLYYYYIDTDFKLDPLYDRIRLNNSAGEYSEIDFSNTYKSSLHSTWKICLTDTDKNKLELEDNMSIPQDWFGKTITKIGIIFNSKLGDGAGTIIISLCRDYSTEDVEFATIADQCPWLENRLIDFKYFLDHSIISKKQYGELMNIIQNDLRLANAKLLVYSEEYYRAWQHKTEVVSKITNKIDTLGAIFNSDFVDAFNRNVKKINTQDFTMAISDLFNSNNDPVLMINYYETLSDYVNKYINAEYTFLKNMYQFRKYFDCKVDYDSYYTYTLTTPNGETENIKYCFTNKINNWKNIGSSNISDINGRSLYELVDGSYVHVNMNDIVTIDNYSNFYQEKAFNNTLVESSGAYKKDTTYYEEKDGVYKKVDLLDMKIAYIEKKYSNYFYKKDSFSSDTVGNWSDLNLKNEVLLKHPSINSEDISESDLDDIIKGNGDSCYQYYKKYIPLTSLILGSEPITVPFVNGENHINFYRRISTQNRWVWGFFSPNPTVRTIRCITELVYRYGNVGFGTEGWTYQDIFGTTLGESFNGYKDLSEKLLYTIKEDSFNSIKITKDNWKSATWENDDASNIALTWSSFITLKSIVVDDKPKYNYRYKTKWWRILREDDKIEKNESYVILYNTFLNDGTKSLYQQPTISSQTESGASHRLNSTLYYPLENVLVPLTTEYVKWDTTNTITLGNWVKTEFNVNSATISNGLVSITVNNTTYKFYVLHQEDYDYEQVSSLPTDKDELKSLALKTWFNTTDFTKISLQNQSDFTNGFYVVAGGDNSYEKVEDVVEDDLEATSWFKKVAPNKYERVYTLKQLVQNKNIYIDSALEYILSTFDDLDEITIPLYRYTKTNEQWFLDGQVEWTFSDFSNKTEVNISEMTNGTFWNKYKNNTTDTILMEHAMLIETTLTEYWTNAYYASKNCRFFLPEFWQPSVDQTTNHFSSSVLLVTGGVVQLSNQLVPFVKPVAGQVQYQFKNTGLKATSEDQKAIDFKLPLNTIYSAKQITEENPFLYDIFNYLKLDLSEWTGTSVKYNYTYYEYEGGGTLWSDALVRLSYGALSYPDQFGGWYDMMIWTLQKGNYQNYIPQQYQNALDEHNRIWRKLYTNYPNLILEQSYTNEDATTSAELFKVSSIAFKDYTNIETQYNITTIDPYNIKNYLGQELRIGDGIELVANELYPDYNSDVYKSLQQYLYITDISYNLRSDKDIQLTVNTIKYADKVIGELVKLIR